MGRELTAEILLLMEPGAIRTTFTFKGWHSMRNVSVYECSAALLAL
jgi:hypothetical protein